VCMCVCVCVCVGVSSSVMMCKCGETDQCVDDEPGSGLRCKCDKNDNQWRADEGSITNKQDLPVKGFCAGDTGRLNSAPESSTPSGNQGCQQYS